MVVEIEVEKSVEHEFRHFWCVVVRGFDSSKHCLPCLLGSRVKAVKPSMVEDGNRILSVTCKPTEFVYICGVSYSFEHAKNFHLVASPTEGETATAKTFRGVGVEIRGASRIQIDAQPAKNLYPHLDSSYLTCRNFQFGAQVYGKSRSGGKILSRQPQLF
jgi:hypothetical protein